MVFIKEFLFGLHALWLSLMPVNQYVEGVVGQPRSFFPHQTETQADKTISDLIFRGLFYYDIYGDIQPDLAESWSISEGGLVYTVTIKEGQLWSDGTMITADDLIYTSFKNENMQGVATDKVDDLTVRYTLPNKFSPFLSILTSGVMKNKSEEEQKALKPISSGPFRVLRIEYSGPVIKQVVLFHGGQDQNIRRLVFKYYSNEQELDTAAKLGEIDGFISKIARRELENFRLYRYPLQGVYYALYFNLGNEKFSAASMREDMAKVLNIDEFIKEEGIFVQGPISRSSYTSSEIKYEIYDGDYKNTTTYSGTEVVITVPDIAQHVKLVEKIKSVWKEKLDLKVEIRKVPPEDFVEEVVRDRNFEILYYGQEIGRDPDRYVNWHSTQKDFPGLNLSGFEQVRSDRALEEGRNETDPELRSTHYLEFQKVMKEEMPAIFLFHPYVNYYVNEHISGLGEKYTFGVGDRFLDFDNWKRE